MEIGFIYMPRSGDRVFAGNCEYPRGVGVYQHSNGCRHVACEAHVSARAAKSGCHWRARGRKALERLVDDLGGVAWDDQGELHYAAPDPWAASAARAALAHVAQAAGDEQSADELRLEDRLFGVNEGFTSSPKADASQALSAWRRSLESGWNVFRSGSGQIEGDQLVFRYEHRGELTAISVAFRGFGRSEDLADSSAA